MLVVDVSLVAGAAQLASTVSRAVRVAAAERSKRTLLLFDNCDGLTEECAKLASSLANDASETTILATCRRRLGTTIEASWQVDPLPVPSGEASPAEIMASAAVALFVDRACAVNARFMLVEADSPDIAQLCRRLDGLPLGIEHAAAKFRLMVDIDTVVPGTFDEATGRISLTESPSADTYGLVGAIAAQALSCGARVLGVRSQDIPQRMPLAAILRYAL